MDKTTYEPGNRIRFMVPGKPQGKARARTFPNYRTGKMQSITPEKTVLYENFIKQCCMEEMLKANHNGFFNKEAVQMQITAYFEIPKSASKKDKYLMYDGTLYPTKKPDADNIAKAVCDALNGILYKDDTQVCALTVFKAYTPINERLQEKMKPCVIVTCQTADYI